nr:hypothetical protein [Stenotrophomonas pavanii]
MALKASFFRIENDLDVAPGSLIRQGTDWLIRAKIEDRHEKADVALCLTGEQIGQFSYIFDPSRCVVLDPTLKLELRVEGIIEGPGGAVIGSLVWSGSSQAICAKDGFFITMAGESSKDFSGLRAFFARNWSIWAVDETGKEIGSGPLVVVSA